MQTPDPKLKVNSRVALVTGGAGRIGAIVVQSLAAAGYAVAIHANRSLYEARETARQFEAAGVRSIAVTANMREEGPVRAMVHRVADHFGRIDALVTCASICHAGPFEDVTAEDLRAHYDVNCIGTFVTAQEVGAVMIHQASGGSIVTMGGCAIDQPQLDDAAYIPSKGAIPALTRSLAVEFAARNPRVRVNCVLPGPVARPADRASDTLEQVAHAVMFLLAHECLTGVCLPIDGGQSITHQTPAVG